MPPVNTTDYLGKIKNNCGLYNGGGGGTAVVYGSTSSDSQTALSGLDDFTTDDIMGIYLDLDANKLYFAKNGTLYNSGTGLDLTDPEDIDNYEMYAYTMAFGEYGGSAPTWQVNFGNGYFGTDLIASASGDAGGEGQFKYNPSTGTFDGSSKNFRAICTNNIATYG